MKLLKTRRLLAGIGITSLIVAIASLPLGLWLPMVTSSKFIFSRHTFSLLSGVMDLYNGEEYALAILIFLFCVLTPIVKLLLLTKFWIQRKDTRHTKTLEWISHIGKWSMIDVFMCAILFILLKLGFTVTITLHSGLYYFISAVLSSMIATESAIQWAKLNRHEESVHQDSQTVSN